MKKFMNSNWLMWLLVLLCVLVFFVYVNLLKIMYNVSILMNSLLKMILIFNCKVIISVFLELNVNSMKYFVMGYFENIKVMIEGLFVLVIIMVNM